MHPYCTMAHRWDCSNQCGSARSSTRRIERAGYLGPTARHSACEIARLRGGMSQSVCAGVRKTAGCRVGAGR